jgi:zinc and cadmium transporter
MNPTWIYALGSVFLIGLIALAGVIAIPVTRKTLNRVVFLLVGLASGAMLGNAIFHLLPESFENASSPMMASVLIAAGYVGCYVLVKGMHLLGGHCHHCESDSPFHEDECNQPPCGCAERKGGHDHESHDHDESEHDADHQRPLLDIDPTGHMSLISHGLDNFCDGILIGVSYLVGIPVGLATTLAIVLHEIPMEFGGFGVLVRAGFSRRNAILVNFSSAVVAMVGTVLTLWLGTTIKVLPPVLTPIACGVVLYNVASGLIPQLQKEKNPRRSLVQFLLMLLGLGVMLAVKLLD